MFYLSDRLNSLGSSERRRLIIFLVLLASWLAGIKAMPEIWREKETLSLVISDYEASKTPREFIYRCCYKHFHLDPFALEFVFDHKKALIAGLGIPHNEFSVDHSIDLEKLREEVDILLSVGGSDAEATKDNLNKLFGGKMLEEQAAEDLFFFAGENGCETIMNMTYGGKHVKSAKVIL